MVSCYNSSKEAINGPPQDDEFENHYIKSTPSATIRAIDSLITLGNLHKSQMAVLLFEKGKNLSTLGRDNQALSSINKALELFEELQDDKYIARTNILLASTNAVLKKKDLATNQALRALKISQKIVDKEIEAKVYNSLAHIHYLYQDYQKSIDYSKQALSIQIQQKDSSALSTTYNNLAIIYKNIADYQNALIYNLKALDLNLALKDQIAASQSYNNLGLVSDQLTNTKEAIQYFEKATSINSTLGRANSSSLRNLGSIYLREEDYKNAKKYYLKALDIEKGLTRFSIQKDIYNVLLHISLNEKDFNNSLNFQEKRDSLYLLEVKLENEEKFKLLQSQYELSQSERKLENQKNINTRNRIIFIVIILSFLLFTFIVLLKLQNSRLKLSKEKLLLEQTVLRSQMNPHFIFNVLSAIQHSLIENNPIKSAGFLSQFAKLIRQNFDFVNKESISLKDEIDALCNYMDTQNIRFTDKFKYTINIEEDIDIHLVEIPPLLIQPFIENSIEHGFKNLERKGTIILNIKKCENKICYEIIDNGKGFTKINNDKKFHSIDIFKKRIQLLNQNDERSLAVNSSSQGTIVKFHLTQ